MKGDDAVDAAPIVSVELSASAEGFVLEEIEMRGFMRYLEKTDPPLRFPEKFTVITGRTGAGKSSILDAVTFALYGQTARTDIQSVKLSDVCRPGGYVRLVFRQGDGHWVIKRGFTSKKDSYLEVTRDGEGIGGTIHDKEETIRDVVGLDYVGFRNSTFVRQEEMKELGSARGADRLAVFQKLFRLEVFERALERAKEQQAAIQTDLRAKDAEILARSETVARLPEARVQLEAVRHETEDRGTKVAGLEARLREAEASLEKLRGEHEAYVKIVATAEERAKRLMEVARKIEETNRRAEEMATLEGELAALWKDVEDLDALREEWEALRRRGEERQRLELAAQATVKLFDHAKRDHERRRDAIKDEIDALHRKIASLRTDIDRDAAFELLRTEGRLEERVARIEREVEWLADKPDLLRTLAEEKRRTEKALGHALAKVQTIDQNSFVLTEIKEQLEELKTKLRQETEDSHRILKPLDDEKVEGLRAVDAVAFTDGDRKRAETLERLIGGKARKRKQADELGARIKAAGNTAALLRELEVQRKTFEDEHGEADAEAARLRAGESRFGETKGAVDDVRKAATEERKALHVAEGQAAQLARHVSELEAAEGHLKEAERERADLHTRLEIYEILVSRVFHKRGVVMYAVDQLLPELEIEASKNLAELTDGRFSRIKLETYEEGRGHGIRILVQGVDALWHDVGEFSGGEKTQVNAALRFAIARELASLPQAGRAYGRMKTLFIDEGDLGSLDTEVSRELFVRKLFRMGEFFEKVILITHLAEVAEKFPGRIRVTMTPSQESRVDVLA